MSNELIVKFHPLSRMLLGHCCRFGSNVAAFWQQCRMKFCPSTKAKRIEHVQFIATLSKGRNSDIVAKNGNNVQATFDFVERIVRLRLLQSFAHVI